MDKIQIQSLADKIASVISLESSHDPMASVQKSLASISERLDRLESPKSNSTIQPQILNPVHPSQDRFAIAEAIVDSLFDRSSQEKACTFEPSKPCDHCSMCSSRGF